MIKGGDFTTTKTFIGDYSIKLKPKHKNNIET
jgi:hypothetical protein